MANESSTFGLNREKLAKLWMLAEGAAPEEQSPDAAQDKAALLRSQLEASLPLEAAMARMLPGVLTVVCEKLRLFTGCSFGALLFDPATDLSILEMIKDVHKEQAASSAPGPKREVATAIYYAAIASAMVHHDVKITKLSDDRLSGSFAELAATDWISADMKHLFAEADKGRIRRMERRAE